MLNQKHYIYFIKSGNKHNSPVKIGLAVNPEKRIGELQVGNPELLKLISSIECRSRKHAYGLERWLHKCFSKHHIRGEWFKGNKINIGRAIAGFETDVQLTNQKGRGIHGTKKEAKINILKGQNIALHKTIHKLNQAIDDELDRECLANMPEL